MIQLLDGHSRAGKNGCVKDGRQLADSKPTNGIDALKGREMSGVGGNTCGAP